MYFPVVLDKRGKVCVVGIGKEQRAIRNTTAQRDRKQQIVIVNATVEVAIEIRKVFDQFNAALLKYFEIEIRLHSLNLCADVHAMVSAHEGVCVAKLKTALLG